MKSKKTFAPEGVQSAGTGVKGVNFAFEDLRGWVEETDRLGELRRVNGASWEEDIGMAAELLLRDGNAPAVLFDEIPGYPKGFRVLTNFYGGKRMNMTMGFPTSLSKLELTDAHFKSDRRVAADPLRGGR